MADMKEEFKESKANITMDMVFCLARILKVEPEVFSEEIANQKANSEYLQRATKKVMTMALERIEEEIKKEKGGVKNG